MLLQRRYLGPGAVATTAAKGKTAQPAKEDGKTSNQREVEAGATPADNSASQSAVRKKEGVEKLKNKGKKASDSQEKRQKPKAVPTDATGNADGNSAEAFDPPTSTAKKKQITSADKARAKRARQKRRKLARQNFKKKDPEVAAEYLQQWSAREEGDSDSVWRFNKATQAWLIRHAYEPDCVAKDTFRMLLRYVVGLRGVARDRMRTHASAIVTLGGAPLVEEESQPQQALPVKKRRKTQKAEEAAEAETSKQLEPPTTSDALQGSEDAAKELDEEEVKRRRMRLRRAKQVVSALGETGDEEARDCET